MKKDETKAFELFMLSAKQNNARAQFKLATAFEQGTLTAQQDRIKAFYWYERSARLSYVPAMLSLAYCHENGIGCMVNLNDAVEWYQKAALTGDVSALDHLERVLSRLHLQSGEGGTAYVECGLIAVAA